MKLSFAKKLTLSYLLVVIVTLLVAGIFLSPRLERDFQQALEQSMAAQVLLLAQAQEITSAAGPSVALQQWIQSRGHDLHARLTVIGADGTVLADSDRTLTQISSMDNHLQRPEIQEALRLGHGEAARHSATLNADMLYVATALRPHGTKPSGVVRIALPLTDVHAKVSAFQIDLLKTAGVGIALAVVIALISVRRTIRPFEELVERTRQIMRRSPEGESTETDEFAHLAGTIDGLANQIADTVDALAREKAQLSAIVSTLVEGVIVLDEQSRLLMMNPAAERLFGVHQTDGAGRPFVEVLRQSALTSLVQETLKTGALAVREITVHTPEEHRLSVQALPVTLGPGKTGTLLALYDISEVRRLERIRQEFMANASHELKTPLTSIKGFVETLLDGAIDDPTHNRAFLKTIEEQSHRLMRLIEDILDLSAIEARRVEFHFEAVALRPLVERIAKALDPQAKAKDVAIRIEITNDFPSVHADREKLAQILMNLIDNAIKFNRPGGTVTITADAAASTASLTVIDTGIGIATADLPRVFERFFRGDKSHSHDIPGTGLGLAIVKHLVEAHGGAVSATSTLGQGSTMRFTLPLATVR